MATKPIGLFLKESRSKLNLTLAQAEKLANISKMYIIAMENDDFDTFPSEFYARAYLKQYAERLQVDVEEVLAAFDTHTFIYVPDPIENTNNYRFVKPAERPLTPDEVIMDDEEAPPQPGNWRYYLPIILLSSIAVIIVGTVLTVIFLNHSNSNNLANNVYSLTSVTSSSSESSASTAASSSSSAAPVKDSLAIQQTGNYLVIQLQTVTNPVKVDLALKNPTSSIWVGLTNSSLPATGATLVATNPAVSANLTASTPSAVMTFVSSTALDIKINGQPLVLTAAQQACSKITFQVSYKAKAEAPVPVPATSSSVPATTAGSQ